MHKYSYSRDGFLIYFYKNYFMDCSFHEEFILESENNFVNCNCEECNKGKEKGVVNLQVDGEQLVVISYRINF